MKIVPKFISFVLWAFIFLLVLINKDWIENKSLDITLKTPYLIFFIIFLHIIFSVFILPCGPISVIYGNMLGFNNGIILSFIISLFCSVLTFQLARTKFNPFLFYNLEKTRNFIIKNISYKKNLVIISSFMNPLFPGSSLGYVFGLIKISKMKFIILSFIGLIPLNIIMVLIGASLAKI